MTDQHISDLGYLAPLLLGLRFNDKVAFGIGSHGTVVEIGGANPQDPVIDDHHFGMDHDCCSRPLILDLRMQQAYAIPQPGFVEFLHEI